MALNGTLNALVGTLVYSADPVKSVPTSMATLMANAFLARINLIMPSTLTKLYRMLTVPINATVV